jgi:hypothetical protein
MTSPQRQIKKRKFDQIIEDECENGFPDDFNIEYSSSIIARDQSIALGCIRKNIMTDFYKALDDGQPCITIDMHNYGISVRKQIIGEVLARFPKINYILNSSGARNRHTITNNFNPMDLNSCAIASEFIIPLSNETDEMDIDKIASYIS